MPHYRITGQYIIEEIGPQPATLDKAIKLANEYALSRVHHAPVFMQVLTEHEPIEYAFGCYITAYGDQVDPVSMTDTGHELLWHEVCRIIPPF